MMCAICHEVFNNNDFPCSTHCGHIFHNNCLMTWFEGQSPSCPQCRATVDKTKLIRLNLKKDLKVELEMKKQSDEKINLLKNELELLEQRNSQNDKPNSMLKLKLNFLKCSFNEKKESNCALKLNLNEYKTKFNELKCKLAALNVDYDVLNKNKLMVDNCFSIKENENHILETDLYEMQSKNTVTIEKLKLELDNSKEKKMYYEKKCNIFEHVKGHLPSPSQQLNIEKNEISVLRKMQSKSQSVSYRSKLTDDNFLCGLVFLIFEERNWCEDERNITSKSKHDIIKYGGTVVDYYLPNVTHVICMSQKSELVQQALKDRKICVTRYWLIDVISKKYITPPWLAYHFPAPYSEETGLPCKNIKISIANFDMNEYFKVKTLIQFTGADFVDNLLPSTNILIAKNLTGVQIEMAKMINVAVVNVQWLNDIISGAQSSSCMAINERYFQFNKNDPFRVNYGILSDLMEAWKYPRAMNCVYQDADVYYPIVNLVGPERSEMRRKEDRRPTNFIDDNDCDDLL